MEGYALRMFENGVLRAIFGHFRKEGEEDGYVFTIGASHFVLLAHSSY